MITKIISVLMLVLVSHSYAFSQENNSFKELVNELEGIYQIQMINVRYNPALDSEIYIQIKENQDLDETTYLNINEFLRIKILSKNAIDNGEFITEKDQIIYLNE